MTKKTYAVVFPGQGSQSVGMLGDLSGAYPVVQETFAAASESLGYDLWALAQTGPEEKIKQTEFTQPLMYVSGVALWRLWSQIMDQHQESIGSPAVVAGHSLGEFCALTASGALAFEDGVALVQRRAELMAGAVEKGQGGMAAILGMEDEQVVALCESITGERVVEAVNFNGPGQVAISGHIDALEKAVALASEQGAKKAVMLPVSVPNHSSLMNQARDELAINIDNTALALPVLPVMQNTFASVPENTEQLTKSLKAHVASPVQWTRSYRQIIDNYSPELVIELGPGKVLAGLGRRIERSVKVHPVENSATLEKALQAMLLEPSTS